MDAERAKAALADLERLQRRRAALLDELRLWVDLAAQGLSETDVEAVGWDERLLTPAEKQLATLSRSHPLYPPWAGEWRLNCGRPLWYNFARLRDGTVRRLNPFLKAPQGEDQ